MSRKVCITGGSRGIGAALVRRFAENGDEVFFLYNKSHRAAEELSVATGAKSLSVDVSDPEILTRAIGEAAKTLGGLDILVNNAGTSLIKLFTDTADDEILSLLHTDLLSAAVASREAAKYMIAAQNGYIVNIGSVWGRVGASCEVAYSAAKAGMEGLTRALAKELGPSHITVNCVEPGVIRTDMNAVLDEETLAALCDETPLGRLGEPYEIAEAVFWLTSGKADFITGQCIGIDGGFDG